MAFLAKYTSLKQSYTEAGQGHVFTFWDQLSEQEQCDLLTQLTATDPHRVNRIYKTAMEVSHIDPASTSIEALPSSVFCSVVSATPAQLANFRDAGINAIRQGKVAVQLLAGGQGTRLGSMDPKGCYDIGLPSGKSLFQLQAERLARLETLAGGNLPWYIMVSGPTRKDTVAFFEAHKFFGLKPDQVHFFEQGILPTLTKEGKILLEQKNRISVAPDGNGGVYAALDVEGCLEHMKKQGVEYIHSYCVDNCLVKVADPVFLGYNILAGSEVGAKTVRRTDPEEPVGVVCLRNGKYSVVEYSEIPKSISAAQDPDGTLKLSAANIANTFYSRAFLERVKQFENNLEYHVAHKKIAHIDLATGTHITPTSPNGIKMELFNFDVFPFCKAFSVFEGERCDEFSPLKNKEGVDSPITSRSDILNLHRRYLIAAGATVADGVEIEISPRFSYAGEGLEVFKGKVINESTQIQ